MRLCRSVGPLGVGLAVSAIVADRSAGTTPGPVLSASAAPSAIFGRVALFPAGRVPSRTRNLATFGLAWCLALLMVGFVAVLGGIDSPDARAYWQTANGPLYVPGMALNQANYIYPPPFAQLLAPLAGQPWSRFSATWSALMFAAFVWLLWPLRPSLRLPCLIAIAPLAVLGNAQPVVGVALVLGLRYPAVWAFPILTKVTPIVGLLWFAVRREWGSLGAALLATAAVAAVSFAIAPDAWGQWADAILADREHLGGETMFWAPPLPIRTALAALLVIWGARTDRAWALAPALLFANPDIVTVTFGVLAAVPRLAERGPQVNGGPEGLRGR